ncbi:MAG: methylenetetrahydrofolate reductase C-terminal domain-containing protein [Acidimicrobiales bacterium]
MSVSPATTEQVMANSWRKPTLRHLLEETDRFLVAVELVTSRGVISDLAGQRALSQARALAESPRIDVLSITDNPAGNAMLAADTLGADLRSHGQEVIIHLACKDGNRNSLESRAWKLASDGFDNILALTGDYPKPGYGGMARPSFDIDSVGLLSMYSEMNRGLLDGATGRPMKPTNFFLGAVVTNHKRHEREVVPQYLKLRRKIETGARFIINQAGYDARKDDELLGWLALSGLEVPVIANVFVLSLGAARAFNAGRVPGVVVTDELVALAECYASSADHGRSFFLELASKQVAIARGLGFRGAYLGGTLDPADCEEILSRAEEFGSDGWKELACEVSFAYPDEFYYFERDEATGLSSSKVNGALVASRTSTARRRTRLRTPVSYRASHLAHWAVFDPEAPLFDVARRFYSAAESASPRTRKVLHLAEHASKVPLYNCKDCGDCSLPEIAYLCPESQCAKNQRNGPCGGSHDGLCEVTDRECIWARAYERLKPYGGETSMLDGPVVFNDNALRGTSAWANTFLGRDHTARPVTGQEDVK